MKHFRIILFSCLVFCGILVAPSTNAMTYSGTYMTITIPECEHDTDYSDAQCRFKNKTGYTFERFNSGNNNQSYDYTLSHYDWLTTVGPLTSITGGTTTTGTTINTPLNQGYYQFEVCLHNTNNCDDINFYVVYDESIEIEVINNIETSGNIVFNLSHTGNYPTQFIGPYNLYLHQGCKNKIIRNNSATFTVQDLIDCYTINETNFTLHVSLKDNTYDENIADKNIPFTGSLTSKSVKLLTGKYEYDTLYQSGNYTIYTFRNKTGYTFERSGYGSTNTDIPYDYKLYESISNNSYPDSRRLKLFKIAYSGSTINTGIEIENIGIDSYKFEVCIHDTDFCDTTYFSITGNTQYTVTIISSNTGYGTVNPESVTADSGSAISTSGNVLSIGSTDVIAHPNTPTSMLTSYSFSGWINHCGNSLTGDCTIIAEFKKTSHDYEFTGDAQTGNVNSGTNLTGISLSGSQYTVTIISSNTGYGTVNPESVTADSGSAISTSGNVLSIGSTDVIAHPNTPTSMLTSYSFSGWINHCGNSLTGDCTIIAEFKKTSHDYEFTGDAQTGNVNSGTNQGNGSQSSATSSSNGSSGKSHKDKEKISDKADIDYGNMFYELINNEHKTNNYETTQTNQNISKYISRSCKPYNIEYIPSLNAYTSPDLKKKEYFVNIDYFKRYVDSKNAQNAECYTNRSRIMTSYTGTNNRTDRYIAPNGKIYFIENQNGLYRSNELNSSKSFSSINEIKNYIKIRNPLISM